MRNFSTFSLLALLSLACGGANRAPASSPTSAAATPATSANASTKTETASPAAAPKASDYSAIVDAADRTADDRKLDAGRHPAELLAFIGAKPGMRIADLAMGSGYTSELLARAIAPSGTLFAQSDPVLVAKFHAEAATAERFARPAMKNAVRVDRAWNDPLPPEAKNLDAVVVVLFYHDLFWVPGADHAKFDAAIFNALKPGGEYILVDHSARAGDGANDVSTLHRIDEKFVKDEVQKAGFVFAEEATFLRNKDDARDWNASPRAAAEKRGTSDRFVFKFVKK